MLVCLYNGLDQLSWCHQPLCRFLLGSSWVISSRGKSNIVMRKGKKIQTLTFGVSASTTSKQTGDGNWQVLVLSSIIRRGNFVLVCLYNGLDQLSCCHKPLCRFLPGLIWVTSSWGKITPRWGRSRHPSARPAPGFDATTPNQPHAPRRLIVLWTKRTSFALCGKRRGAVLLARKSRLASHLLDWIGMAPPPPPLLISS